MMKKDDAMMAKDVMMMSGSTESGAMMSGEKMMAKDTMMKDDKMMAKDEKMMMKHGEVVNYSKGIITKYANAGKTVVILFDATRCPTCVALNTDITANIASLPENVVIVKADYDTATALKKVYKVTTQNTIVVVKKHKKKYKIVAKKSGGFDTLAKVTALIK
jgi:thiol-disulfide isomerase/thioredoxin